MPFSSRRKAGFTLLESLVAFLVFSIFMIAVHKSFVAGIKGQAAAGFSDRAAEAVMSEFSLVDAGLAPEGTEYRKEVGEQLVLVVRRESLTRSRLGVHVPEDALEEVSISVLGADDIQTSVFSRIVKKVR